MMCVWGSGWCETTRQAGEFGPFPCAPEPPNAQRLATEIRHKYAELFCLQGFLWLLKLAKNP